MDIQASHSSRIANAHYRILTDSHPNISADLFKKFETLLDLWPRLILTTLQPSPTSTDISHPQSVDGTIAAPSVDSSGATLFSSTIPEIGVAGTASLNESSLTSRCRIFTAPKLDDDHEILV